MKKTIFIFYLFIIISTNAQEMFKNFEIRNLKINNKHDNYGTAFYKNNSIVFASASSNGKLHLFKGEIINGNVDKYWVFSKGSKNDTHESNVAFTNDYKTVYFTRSLYGKEYRNKTVVKKTIALFKATINSKGVWTNIIELPFNDKNYDVGHPTLNKENTKLYFSSNMPGGFGKTDIYQVDILPNGNYSEPNNLGPSINSTGNDIHPYISGDNFLYFSSNGHPGNMGGLDIYVSQVNENGVSKPEHVNAPVNSKWDDFSFIIDYTKRIGFFSSNRPGGKGRDDIYYFKETIIKEKEEVVEIEPEVIKEECNQIVKGYVYLNATNKKIPNTVVNLVSGLGKKLESFTTLDDAKFQFNIKCNEKYFIEAGKEGYKPFTKSIKTLGLNKKQNKLDLYLLKIKEIVHEKKKLKVGEIGFNFNEAKLLKRFTYQLDKAIILMSEDPNLKIEIESHTDSRAEDEFNMRLTEERIFAIYEYLGQKGITADRIKGKAFGETMPLNKCVNNVECTEDEFLLNRRTMFKLIKK